MNPFSDATKTFPKETGKYPTPNRTCTDFICMVIFAAFWVFMIVGSIYGLRNGDLDKIAQPYDSVGSPCGTGNASNFGYLFFNAPQSLDLNNRSTVCVKECPTSNTSSLACLTNTNTTDCSKLEPYETKLIAERFCMPYSDSIKSSINKKLSGARIETVIDDLKSSWVLFLIALLAALVMSVIFSYLIQWCAGLIITVIILGLIGSLLVLGFLLRSEGIKREARNDDQAIYFTVGSWICFGLDIFFFFSLCCLWSRISLAISIIQATSEMITDYFYVLIVPIINIVLFLVFITYWIWIAAYIYSSGDSRYTPGSSYGTMIWSTQTRIFFWVHFVGLFWNVAFIIFLSNFVIIVVACSWYFAFDRSNPGSPISKGFKWGLTYHIGSIAFGSLILAVIWIVQVILAYMQQQVESMTGATNVIIKWALRVVNCFVLCFERFIKFLNKHAFIEVVLKSYSFCTSAQNAMAIILGNALRMGVLHGLTYLVIALGTLTICASSTIVSYLLLSQVDYFNSKVANRFVPLIACCVIGYVTSSIYEQVFKVGSDAIIHCYIVEEEEGGSGRAPAKLSNAISDAKERNGALLATEPLPGYGVPATAFKPSDNNQYKPLKG